MKIYLDGKFVNKEDATVSVFDHGLLYGDGIFEGIRAYNGRVFRLREHIDRLWDSGKAIALNIPMTKAEMEKALLQTLAVNKLTDAYIRLVVTRGIGDLGLDPANCNKPTVFIIADGITLYPEKLYTEGLEVITVSTRRNMPDALSPNIKSLNYLNNIMAKLEAKRAGVPEAIMLNEQGYVVECSGDNIFVIKNGVVSTPPASAGALKGVTRNAAMELIKNKLKMELKEELITTYDLYCADECFLTGTAAETIPVVKIDGRIIGEGKPGKVTLKLFKEFRSLTRSTGVPIKKK
ncbi:MAG: branched-chain-amino-acid transaminase [Endomicrobiaceae bacterium]